MDDSVRLTTRDLSILNDVLDEFLNNEAIDRDSYEDSAIERAERLRLKLSAIYRDRRRNGG